MWKIFRIFSVLRRHVFNWTFCYFFLSSSHRPFNCIASYDRDFLFVRNKINKYKNLYCKPSSIHCVLIWRVRSNNIIITINSNIIRKSICSKRNYRFFFCFLNNNCFCWRQNSIKLIPKPHQPYVNVKQRNRNKNSNGKFLVQILIEKFKQNPVIFISGHLFVNIFKCVYFFVLCKLQVANEKFKKKKKHRLEFESLPIGKL